jgi:hypothetical protein
MASIQSVEGPKTTHRAVFDPSSLVLTEVSGADCNDAVAKLMETLRNGPVAKACKAFAVASVVIGGKMYDAEGANEEEALLGLCRSLSQLIAAKNAEIDNLQRALAKYQLPIASLVNNLPTLEEAEKVAVTLRVDTRIVPNCLYNFIPRAWVDTFMAMVKEGVFRVCPIDTRSLVETDPFPAGFGSRSGVYDLRRDARQGHDFVIVPTKTWNTLVGWFGLEGPVLARTSVQVGDVGVLRAHSLRIPVYEIVRVGNGGTYEKKFIASMPYFPHEHLQTLREDVAAVLDVDPTTLRVWDNYELDAVPVVHSSTFSGNRIVDGNTIVIERVNSSSGFLHTNDSIAAAPFVN